jgi:DNA-binding response OmpR family regulator
MDLAKTILIIDDEENIRKYLGHSLSMEGFAVETAKYGKEGINLTSKARRCRAARLNLPDIRRH